MAAIGGFKTPLRALFNVGPVLTRSGAQVPLINVALNFRLTAETRPLRNNKNPIPLYKVTRAFTVQELQTLQNDPRFKDGIRWGSRFTLQTPLQSENEYSSHVIRKLFESLCAIDDSIIVSGAEHNRLAAVSRRQAASFPDYILCDETAFEKNDIVGSGVLVIDVKSPRVMSAIWGKSKDVLNKAIKKQMQNAEEKNSVSNWAEGAIRSIVNAVTIGCSTVLLTDLFCTVKIVIEKDNNNPIQKDDDWRNISAIVESIVCVKSGYDNYISLVQQPQYQKKIDFDKTKTLAELLNKYDNEKVYCSATIDDTFESVLEYIYNEFAAARKHKDSWGNPGVSNDYVQLKKQEYEEKKYVDKKKRQKSNKKDDDNKDNDNKENDRKDDDSKDNDGAGGGSDDSGGNSGSGYSKNNGSGKNGGKSEDNSGGNGGDNKNDNNGTQSKQGILYFLFFFFGVWQHIIRTYVLFCVKTFLFFVFWILFFF